MVDANCVHCEWRPASPWTSRLDRCDVCFMFKYRDARRRGVPTNEGRDRPDELLVREGRRWVERQAGR